MLTPQALRALDELHRDATAALERTNKLHGPALLRWDALVQKSFHHSIERFQSHTVETSGGASLCAHLAALTADYVEWMQWALGDLAGFALALDTPPAAAEARIGPAALIYFAGRVLDDFLDRHHLYRGRRMTLLASIAEERGAGAESDALTVLLALLLTMDGLEQLSSAGQPIAPQIITSLRRLLTGILMDRSQPQDWSEDFYARLIELKNVDYWRILYDALDPKHAAPMYPVLCGYYALAQKLNDLEDYTRDEAQGRPNIVSIFRRTAPAGDATSVLACVAVSVVDHLLQLHSQAASLPTLERDIVLLRLEEARTTLTKLGLLATEPVAIVEVGVQRGGLAWHATVDEFVQRYGIDALEHTVCPVCGSDDPLAAFRKQGFQFNRCSICSHLYVSPRLREPIVQQLFREEAAAATDPFLESQRIYADHLCRLLLRGGPGRRLLDLGHGAGHLMLAARAYGFQVYGVDMDQDCCEALRPVFGDRVQHVHLPLERLPWGNFDHVVLSHVLEHLPDPAAALPAIAQAMQPDALLYVAVPDSDALQLKIFGRLWDAVHPIMHPQFFNERSLRQLLESAAFEVIARVPSPALDGPDAQRWMCLFRSLGGDESGELALLARRRTLPDSPVVNPAA